ncbi:MAG: response regulator [Lachnospiraceae bacterium]|nr:response regulator [Lachnospiraceae bacterium]
MAVKDPSWIGGGYAATNQIENVGFTAVVYDATNGLPTSDANYVLGARDGHVWIGSYSGIMKYDGSTFTRVDNSNGLTSGRGLFEDSNGRIFVGTNDNGVVVINGNEQTHITYKDGLPASSIRVFAEDRKGNVYVGTTAGVCYLSPELKVHKLEDERLDGERVLRLSADLSGCVYGQTKSGLIFKIKDQEIAEVYSSEELGMHKITSILADPQKDGNVYIATEEDVIYHGTFGNKADQMDSLSTAPLTGIHWISYDCNRLWVSSTSMIGYFDQEGVFTLSENLPLVGGIEMMTSDYQGNMWFASSTQGVMKIVADNFVDLYASYGTQEEVTNAACLHNGELYVGTDNGLRIMDVSGKPREDALIGQIGTTRIRCIMEDSKGNLWIGCYTNDMGLICLGSDGSVTSYTYERGMPDNEIRCICEASDGTILAGTDGGIACIKDGNITDTITASDGLKNTVILTLAERDGTIWAGTDGGGLYRIKDSNLKSFHVESGLTSDVIIRIKEDEKRGVLWLITSNSIMYLKDDVFYTVRSFPYSNNYDLYFDKRDDMWIVSSYGIYVVRAEAMLADKVEDYRLYTLANGLPGTPTSMSYSAISEDGFLFIPERNGLCRVNMDHFSQNSIPVKTAVGSIRFGEEQILPDKNGIYQLPNTDARISITASVMDYTLQNPIVSVYLDGKESEGVTAHKSDLTTLEYTGLRYGNYKLHIKVFDNAGRLELLDETYTILKEPRLAEVPQFRLLIVLAIAALVGFGVWRFMKNTIINKQYEEIRLAKEEAERANLAKTRFLANMSHEIRTPINAIMGVNEMALREDATGVPKPYFMSMINYALNIRNASESLLSLINDLLDLSKVESGKMNLVEQEYDVQDMLRSVISIIRVKSTEKELTFDVVVDETLPKRLYGDVSKIKQIILNLLTNAVKYTAFGGLTFSVSMEERQDETCKLCFSVKDTGIGIKQEDMDKLFTAYERLDEQKNSGIQGTGLGLDISRRFADIMGGELTCESQYGKGSEFLFTVEQKIVDQTPVGIFSEQSDSVKRGAYVPQFIAPDADILVVDDNPMNLSVIKGLLKGTKVFVSTASSGEDCLEKIKDTRFDVVLLDHMMPGMDGVETVAEIRKTNPDLPVYALTANTSYDSAYYISKGFNGYLQKPIDSMVLEKTIMRHIPEEKMEKPAQQAAEEELTEIPADLLWIYDTKGISAPDGIRNSGGIPNYIGALNMFLDTIEENEVVIREAYESGNIRLFTIKVHALKSSARIIGALQLSELAEKLEDAGNKEDMEFIDANAGILLKDYEEFKDKLSGLRAGGNDDDKEKIPEEELQSAYDALAEMIPQMDYDAVEMILDELGGYELPEEDDKIVGQLSKKLRSFDWDGMEELIQSKSGWSKDK